MFKQCQQLSSLKVLLIIVRFVTVTTYRLVNVTNV